MGQHLPAGGVPCRHDGRDKASPELDAALAGRDVVSFCPEAAGGLPTPRRPAELSGGDGHGVLDGTARVVEDTGRDVTAALLERNGVTVRVAPGA